jgi:hypothetical protein
VPLSYPSSAVLAGSAQTWTVTNGSTDRVFDAAVATPEEIAAALAQLLADLQQRKVVG